MKFTEDKDNICLNCIKGEIHGKYRPSGAPCDLTCCTCKDVNLSGPNKGARRQCRAFEPKTHEEGVSPC